jgi:hypothetical protein
MRSLFFAILLAFPLYCAQEAELKDADGKTIIRYVVEVPAGIAAAGTADPAKQVGLFLCFAEHERPTGDELLPVREALRRQGISDDYILLAGHSQALKMSLADHEPIRKMTEWAMKNYPINPRRIYMYGKGEGGKVSGEFSTTHPKLITAAITYSWGWWVMPPELTEPLDPVNSAPEFYMVLGLRDLATHINTVRDTYGRVHAKGYHVIYREFDDLGARTFHPASNDDAVAWVTRLRNKNIPPSAGEIKLLKQFDSGTPRPGPQGYFETLALVGGVPAGAVIQKLLASKDATIRAAAAETCGHANFGEETLATLGRSVVDPDQKVRLAALRALAMQAEWRSEAAQKALIDLATHPEKAVDPADRITAVDALGYTVRFQVKGVRQDPQVFKTLVGLLTDKDEEVRVMASNILAPIRDGDFRGDAGRPEKKTPEGGWQHWLDEITAKDAGYLKDYEVCGASKGGTQEAIDLYCTGGSYLLGYKPGTGEVVRKQPALAFQNTMRAAEMGYVPAEAALGMMYANGKGTEQDYAEAGKWWTKAAEGGHVLAAANAARAPKTPAAKP